MSDKPKHTPTPWHIVQNGSQIDIHARVVPNREAPREIATATDLREDDASMIVRAVNSFEAMRAALRLVVYGVRPGHQLEYDSKAWNEARTALALADKEH